MKRIYVVRRLGHNADDVYSVCRKDAEMLTVVAEFGKTNARRYAKEHADRLNRLESYKNTPVIFGKKS